MLSRHVTRAAAIAGVLALTASLVGCAATVSKEEYTSEVAKLREEMQAGDRQIGGRVDSTNLALTEQQRRIDALEQELQAFRSEYQVSMEKTKGMLKFSIPVHFEFDRSELREADLPVLDRFASVVKEYYPDALITVEGFADPAGSRAYNLRLSQARAETVRDYLVGTGGLPAEGLRAVSYGEVTNRQVVAGAQGPGDEGVENRRVTLVIDHAGVAADQVAMP